MEVGRRCFYRWPLSSEDTAGVEGQGGPAPTAARHPQGALSPERLQKMRRQEHHQRSGVSHPATPGGRGQSCVLPCAVRWRTGVGGFLNVSSKCKGTARTASGLILDSVARCSWEVMRGRVHQLEEGDWA